MAATSTLAIRCVYADETKSTINIGNLRKTNINGTNIKTKVAAFNNSQGGDLASKMKSKNGANWVLIDRVTLTTTERTYIF